MERLFSEAPPACSVKKTVTKLISSAEEKKRKEYWSMLGEEGAEGRTKRKKRPTLCKRLHKILPESVRTKSD